MIESSLHAMGLKTQLGKLLPELRHSADNSRTARRSVVISKGSATRSSKSFSLTPLSPCPGRSRWPTCNPGGSSGGGTSSEETLQLRSDAFHQPVPLATPASCASTLTSEEMVEAVDQTEVRERRRATGEASDGQGRRRVTAERRVRGVGWVMREEEEGGEWRRRLSSGD